jgi:hypothetical protein
MAGDLIRDVRRAVLAHQKADADVKALIPAANMFPSTTPAEPVWPFTRMDGFSSTAIDLSCVAGATVTFLLHAFTKPKMRGKAVLDTAEDQASRMATALKLALHNRRLPIEGGAAARLRIQSVRILQDRDEATAYHAVLSVEARVLAA